MSASGAAELVLAHVLQALRPLVRLLMRHGITYTALAAALKRVFVEEAERELAHRGMARTASAVTLLSGVHRKDVRHFTEPAAGMAAAAQRGPRGKASEQATAPSLAAEVVGRWMHERRWLDKAGHPRTLPRGTGERGSFDALVEAVSRGDVRPRAVLDELVRLGAAEETPDGVRLLAEGFAPRQGLAQMAELFGANLHDHAAAAVGNLLGEHNFLEQAIFVDELSEASAKKLADVAKAAWLPAMREVMGAAQQLFDADQAARQITTPAPSPQGAKPPEVPPLPRRRARIGIYFFSEAQE